jgi:hypothetical protein
MLCTEGADRPADYRIEGLSISTSIFVSLAEGTTAERDELTVLKLSASLVFEFLYLYCRIKMVNLLREKFQDTTTLRLTTFLWSFISRVATKLHTSPWKTPVMRDDSGFSLASYR